MHKKSPPHAERSTNTFILTLQSDFVKHPPSTILASEVPADAPILANTNFSQDSFFYPHFDLWRRKKDDLLCKIYESNFNSSF